MESSKRIIDELKKHYNAGNLEGMARFGINTKNAIGVPIPELRKIAKRVGKDHKIAIELWDSKIHDARILASMVDDPEMVSKQQMDRWASAFDSWDVCDQCCSNLFSHTAYAYDMVFKWANNDKEFVKRAGYALIAAITVHDKEAKDEKLIRFLPLIEKASTDERNFVKKAVNWALRQIGKRNANLNKIAIKTAIKISKMDSKSAKWIASDAIRELKSR